MYPGSAFAKAHLSGMTSESIACVSGYFFSASPSASAITRNTSVLSIDPCTRSLPGPVAVRITSSPECTLAFIIAGRLPSLNTAPGTSLYLALALNVAGSSPFCVGSLGLSSFGRSVS